MSGQVSEGQDGAWDDGGDGRGVRGCEFLGRAGHVWWIKVHHVEMNACPCTRRDERCRNGM